MRRLIAAFPQPRCNKLLLVRAMFANDPKVRKGYRGAFLKCYYCRTRSSHRLIESAASSRIARLPLRRGGIEKAQRRIRMLNIGKGRKAQPSKH